MPVANDVWETKALEDGQVVFEQVDLDSDAPILYRLAAWCERQHRIELRPLAKTTGEASDGLLQRATGSERR